MAGTQPSGIWADWYEKTVGTPTTDDEVYGYWVFALGVFLGILGVIVFAATAPRTTARAIGYALVAASPPLVMIGAIIRFPLQPLATKIAGLGGLLTAVAIGYFLMIFPGGWTLAGGNPIVNNLYAVGIVVIGLAGAFVPLITPTPDDAETAPASASAATGTDAEAGDTAAELEDTQTRVRELEEELAVRETELEAFRSSNARFEVYEDRAGKARWRLRHRNGNVIGDSGQGYASRQKAQQGLQSVKRNAAGAGILRVEPAADADVADEPEPDDADDPAVAVPGAVAELESRATFERYEDDAGEWRWRLAHDNGNILADSGEGYSSRSNVTRAMNRVREHVAAGEYLRIDPTAFELYRDTAGEYRWRLLHENGNILADSGEGYASRQKARQGAESVRSNAGDAEIDGEGTAFERYEDAAGQWRWRLRHRNGNVIADSGEGYASKDGAEEAIENVREYAPEASLLDIGQAAFEIYQDEAEEWRWRLRHRNGNILADSGEGYASRSSAEDGIDSVKRNAPGADEE